MRVVRWMCNVKIKDKVPRKETRERLGHIVREYPGEPVPEKNIHPPTILIIMRCLSSSSIYYDT